MIKKIRINGLPIPSSCLLLLLLSLASCSRSDSDTAPLKSPVVKTSEGQITVKAGHGDPEKGKVIFEKYCFYCHGREGRGDGAIGIAVSPHPADFVGDKRKMAKTDEELLKSISEGIRREVGSEEMAMPRWKGILSEEDMRNVLAYVRVLSKGGKQD